MADQIVAEGGQALALCLDVADVASIDPAMARIERELGPLDILVNNAGVGGEGQLASTIKDCPCRFVLLHPKR